MTEPLSAAERKAMVKQIVARYYERGIGTNETGLWAIAHAAVDVFAAREVAHRAEVDDLRATEAVLRGEIRRSEAALEIFDRVVTERDQARAEVEAARAETRALREAVEAIEDKPGRHDNHCAIRDAADAVCSCWRGEIKRALAQHAEPVAPCGDLHAGDCSLDCSERAAVRELRRVDAWPLAQHAEPDTTPGADQ